MTVLEAGDMGENRLGACAVGLAAEIAAACKAPAR